MGHRSFRLEQTDVRKCSFCCPLHTLDEFLPGVNPMSRGAARQNDSFTLPFHSAIITFLGRYSRSSDRLLSVVRPCKRLPLSIGPGFTRWIVSRISSRPELTRASVSNQRLAGVQLSFHWELTDTGEALGRLEWGLHVRSEAFYCRSGCLA